MSRSVMRKQAETEIRKLRTVRMGGEGAGTALRRLQYECCASRPDGRRERGAEACGREACRRAEGWVLRCHHHAVVMVRLVVVDKVEKQVDGESAKADC